jgi:hypothetical protein
MIMDKFLEFSDAQAVTATAISTNVVDLYPLGNNQVTNLTRDIGTGEDIYLVVNTVVAATDASSDATLVITLESDDNTSLSSPTVHYTSATLAFAAFSPANTELVKIKLPAGNYERYLGVRFTVAAGPLTAGNFDAFLVKDAQAFKAYKAGFTIQ